MKLELRCGLKFPFLHKAFQILASVVPEGELTHAQELMFVLRAYGKAITGQTIQIEEVDDLIKQNSGGFNTISGYIGYLNYGDSQAMSDPMGRKTVAIEQFNTWLKRNKFNIVIQANPKYLNSKSGV